MYEHKTLRHLDDYFREETSRVEPGVYFIRINGLNGTVRDFIRRYYESARKTGVVIEGRIRNPDEKNLAFFEEIMGLDFQLSLGFITSSLGRWLPRMNLQQKNRIAGAIYDTLEAMRREGKNQNMLQNGYIKFMCWLYYRFEPIVGHLGDLAIPKILYEGEISNYELKLLSILSKAGSDIVLLQYKGDEGYRKLDPQSLLSEAYEEVGLEPFPEYFSIKWMREEMEREWRVQSLYGILPKTKNATNVWIEGKGLGDILKPPTARGGDPGLFYNCFCRINGVEDKLTYLNDLYQFYLQLKQAQRRTVIVEQGMAPPSNDEIMAINRGNYQTQEQMILGLSRNIQFGSNLELQRLMVKAFVDLVAEEGKNPELSLNKLTGNAVYLLCWLKRYQSGLFSGWKEGEIACLICLGGCKNTKEALFLRMLSRLPVDVLVLCPDLNHGCCLADPFLYEKNHTASLTVDHFPSETANIKIGTAAYHAERELDEIMYQDSGIYRNHQYKRAVSISLQTMYEEIGLLWGEELKYRPNFSVVDQMVNMPVIFAKISGVKDGLLQEYWSGMKQLMGEDTLFISQVPFRKPTDPNPIKAFSAQFFKQGKILRDKIKAHPAYEYGVLREEMQNHLLDKLQALIDQKLISGTFENGMEYNIIATGLNLGKDLIRMVQKFDFTKRNPKIIYVNPTEEVISLEDSILMAFLNLTGFDILFFVPTGYQTVERYFTKKVMEEHQIGEYCYDLTIPDFHTISSAAANPFRTLREKIFKRGN